MKLTGIAVTGAVALFLPMIGMNFSARADSSGSGISTVDVAEGDRLAHMLCVNCHVVDTRGPLLRTDRVPSFPWIAQQPGLTPEFLADWLATSHERMPDFSLTREEIRQLSAYIYSLRNP